MKKRLNWNENVQFSARTADTFEFCMELQFCSNTMTRITILFYFSLTCSLCLTEWVEIPKIERNSPTKTPGIVEILRKEAIPNSSTEPTLEVPLRRPEFEEETEKEEEGTPPFEDPDTTQEEDGPNVLWMIKNVQNELMDFEGASLDAKLNRLKLLRNDILFEIKTRIAELFKTTGKEARVQEDEHQLEYPSNEGALMTIGFLTFGVFLIKLVLKLIYALKMRQQIDYPTSTTAASIYLKNEPTTEQSLKILKGIEEYQQQITNK